MIQPSMLPFNDPQLSDISPLQALPTRERLIRAAVALFQERGYYGVGVSEILTLAEPPKGSLYHHFPGGKQDLAIAGANWLTSEIVSFVREARKTGAKTRELLKSLFKRYGYWLEQEEWRQGTLLSVLAQEVAQKEPDLTATLSENYDRLAGELAKCLIQDGVPKRSAKRLAHFIFSALEGAITLAKLTQSKAPLLSAEKYINAAIDAEIDSQD